jgi:ParB-like chromosome segregation protein Spo0J
MTPRHSHCLELDLHRLDLRFAGSRLVQPHAVARLAESIERCGQIVPCIVVAIPGDEGGGAEALVLIDDYRRLPRCAGSAATPPASSNGPAT